MPISSSANSRPLSDALRPDRVSGRPADAPQPRVIRIANHPVGDNQRAFVIAEAGVNHDGSVAAALELVDAAAEAGADACKFQLFDAEELAADSAGAAAYQRAAGETSQRQMLARLELPEPAVAALQERCRSRGLVFLATPFGIPELERLLDLGAAAIKISSTDLTNAPLLRSAAAAAVPLIVSTGAATADEIAWAVDFLRAGGAAERLILLHCVSAYPTPLECANLRAIAAKRAAYGAPVGFSDHTLSVRSGAWATAAGACVLEKHFTLDRARHGPDHAISLSPPELREYIRAVREVEMILGDGRIGFAKIEEDVRAVARKSVVLAQDVAAGQTIALDMLTIKRPGGGIDPRELEQVAGRVARRDLPRDTVLTWSLLT